MNILELLKSEFLSFGEFNSITVIVRLVIAAVMGGLIGGERGRHGRAAGLRTHILICIGAAITSLTSIYLSLYSGNMGDMARLSAQVISGIGFLGAGTILIRNSSIITGLTTAAGMWATAAIGIAVGFGFYSGAICAAVICLITVTLLGKAERKRKTVITGYLELSDIQDIEKAVEILHDINDALLSYDVIAPKSGHTENVGITFLLHAEKHFSALEKKLRENCSVVMMLKDINS